MTRRTLLAASVLALPLAVAVPAFAAPAPATVQPVVRVAAVEDPASAAAVRAITDPSIPASVQVSSIPSGLGYRAAEGPGYAVNPTGDCSSGLRLPDAFTDPCRAHDLGYDLLRHADAAGRPLGSWARTSIDDALSRRLQAACARRSVQQRRECEQVAAVAVFAVRANSWRQHDGPPRAESAAELASSWITAGGRL